MEVLDDEAEEDIMRLAGVGEGSLSDRVVSTVKRRFPWLFVNLVTAIVASLVIAQFEPVISTFVALAVLMGVLIWTNPRDRAELAQTFAALTRTGR